MTRFLPIRWFAGAVLLGSFPLACAVDSSPADGAGGSSTGGSFGSGAASGSGGSSSGGGGAVSQNCIAASDCALVAKTCCGTCGAPTESDMIGIAKGNEAAYRDSVCGDNFGCPACALMSEPNLHATCEGGLCQARDLRTEPASACTVAADCVVRPAACCECGASTEPYNLVALNKSDTSFGLSLCEGPTVCLDCAWVAPPEVSAICDAGHCQVVDSRLP